MSDPGQGCGCARCREPLPAVIAGEGGPEAEAYARRRVRWRRVYLRWVLRRPLPGSPETRLKLDPLIPQEGP